MSLRGFRVPRATVQQIRTIAEALRHTLQGQNFKSMEEFLDGMINDLKLLIVPDNASELPGGFEAGYDPEKRCILLRDSDYKALCRGTGRRSRFTFWHEFGHFFLNHRRVIGRATANELPHSYEEDSEWQANTFAAEFLMPYSVIKREGLTTPEQIMHRFKVSRPAAVVRLKALKEEGR
nr:MAG TPA: IrrE protein [Caudoviricetes sp.]